MNPLSSSELSLAFLIVCSVKATILLTFAWITASAARRRSAAFRHLAWAAGILGSLTLPLVTLLLPAWRSPIYPSRPMTMIRSPSSVALWKSVGGSSDSGYP